MNVTHVSILFLKRVAACCLLLSAFFASAVGAQERVRIVGSSTVYPFSSAVAETFGRGADKTPVVESTGSGGGFKLFCAGVGVQHPDITNASRPIKSKEQQTCQANGVTPIEVLIGFDGIAIVNSLRAKPLSLTLEQLYRALAKQVPVNGNLVNNPYIYWSDISANLPKIKIEVLGPPPTSGTRDAFVEIAMEGGARAIPMLERLRTEKGKKAFKRIAHTLRTDGAYIEAGENDNLIVQKLKNNTTALGIFGFSFLSENADTVQSIAINNIMPTFDNIASKRYPISRSLYFYVKAEHTALKSAIGRYVKEFVSDDAWGEDGYLAEKGLIPLSPTAKQEVLLILRKHKVL